jgi:hypothetical protein
VDEIVLAQDERADPPVLPTSADLADRMYVVPAVTHMERYLGWLHDQCSGDWILRVDDDELPTTQLLEALPALVTERELTHFWLPRRWVHPTAAEFIADGPWARDVQVRLVRNVPGLWRFQGLHHTNIEVLGANRVADAPLLHLVTLLNDVDERRERAAASERLVPGLTHESGMTISNFYLPEDVSDLRRDRLPDEDERRISSFLDRRRGPARQTRATAFKLPTPSEADLNRWLADRPVSAGAYRARVRLVDDVAPMPAESLQHIQVEVTNLGDDWWPRGPQPEPEITVGHRWRREDGTDIERPTPRTPFSEIVGPGSTTRLIVALQAPPERGNFELRVDVVHEHVRWFECAATQRVEVTNPNESVLARDGPSSEARAALSVRTD